jgi:hypothetical protein
LNFAVDMPNWALRRHLENSLRAIDSGRYCAAAAQLEALVDQVGSFIDEGILTEEQAAPLIEGAKEVIEDPQVSIVIGFSVAAGAVMSFDGDDPGRAAPGRSRSSRTRVEHNSSSRGRPGRAASRFDLRHIPHRRDHDRGWQRWSAHVHHPVGWTFTRAVRWAS